MTSTGTLVVQIKQNKAQNSPTQIFNKQDQVYFNDLIVLFITIFTELFSKTRHNLTNMYTYTHVSLFTYLIGIPIC